MASVDDSMSHGLDIETEDSFWAKQTNTQPMLHTQFDFTEDFTKRLHDGLMSGLLCDLKFVIGPERKTFKAHRFVIAIASPVFYSALTSGFAESEHGQEYIIDDIDPVAFEQFILYAYSENHRLTGSNVFPTLLLARRYNCDRLIADCEIFIENEVTPTTAMDMLIHAGRLGLDSTIDRLLKRAVTELDFKSTFIERENVSEMPYALVSAIVGSDFITSPEADLFNFLMKWLDVDLDAGQTMDDVKLPEERQQQFRTLMHNIRFYDMDLSFFGDRVVASKAVTAEEAVSVYRLAIALNTRDVSLKDVNVDEFNYTFTTQGRSGGARKIEFDRNFHTPAVQFLDGGYRIAHEISAVKKNNWVLAKMEPVTTGVHVWRIVISASGSWFMFGICPRHDYGQGDDVQLFNKSEVFGLIFNSGKSVSAVRNGSNENVGNVSYTQEGSFEMYMKYDADAHTLDFRCSSNDWEKCVDKVTPLSFVPCVNLYYADTQVRMWRVPKSHFGKKILRV